MYVSSFLSITSIIPIVCYIIAAGKQKAAMVILFLKMVHIPATLKIRSDDIYKRSEKRNESNLVIKMDYDA
jgi:hypothetical protein